VCSPDLTRSRTSFYATPSRLIERVANAPHRVDCLSTNIENDVSRRLQKYRGVSRPVRAAFYVPAVRHGRGRQAYGAGRQVRQGGLRAQERAPDYQLVAAWSAFLIFIGAGAFAVGMAIHNETLAAQRPPHPEQIYYCATGDEMPLFEPCKEMKAERNI